MYHFVAFEHWAYYKTLITSWLIRFEVRVLKAWAYHFWDDEVLEKTLIARKMDAKRHDLIMQRWNVIQSEDVTVPCWVRVPGQTFMPVDAWHPE